MDNNVVGNGSPAWAPDQTENQHDSLLQIFLWHRWTILLTIIGFLVAASVYIIKATPLYTSESRLYVEQTGPRIISEYEGVMTRSNNYLYTQGELIRSTPIITEVAEDPSIRNLKTFADIDNLVGYLKKNLNVAIGKNDDIITVSFDSPYPPEAAQLVNAVVDSYVNYHSVHKRSTVSEVLGILQKEKVKRDKELSDKFTELLQFTRDNGVVSFDNNGGNIVFERLSKLSGALTEAELVTLNAKADYDAIQGMVNEPDKIRQFAGASGSSSVQVLSGERENQLRTELRQAELELEDARNQCTEDHPSIQAIHIKIGRIKQELDEQYTQFAEAYVEVMRLRWLAAKQREDELAESFEIQHQAAQELGIKAAEYTVLQSELDRAERVCEVLDDRIKELNVTEDTGALNISILEVARPADGPSQPQKAKIMTMSLALGIVFGMCLALLRDWMDYRLRSSDEITALLGIPVLGEVPTMTMSQSAAATRGHKIWLRFKSFFTHKPQIALAKAVSITSRSKIKFKKQTIMARAKNHRAMLAAGRTKTQEIISETPVAQKAKKTSQIQTAMEHGQVVRFKPRSPVAEAYRTIRTSVFFGVTKGGAKSILVTSPAPSDGKTTLVSNLAIAMAQAGQKTLIIDADLRKPTQYKIFNISSEPGLTSVLAGIVRLDEAIQPGPVKGLHLLPNGPDVQNPSEILNSDAFALILQNLTKCYDRVIIDSPPVMPVADSQVIAARCDTVLLVVRAEKSTRRLIQHARDSLTSVGGHVLGAVVNDVTRKRGRYGYGRYHRGYGYGYGYGSYYGYYGEDKDNKTENRHKYEQEVFV